jgi:hypothetical protein
MRVFSAFNIRDKVALMKGEVSKLNPAFGKQTYRYVAYGIIELD